MSFYQNRILSNTLPIDLDYLKEGCLIMVDKPKDWTSFDVVNKIRGKIRYNFDIKKIKVGHAGTLDPMATGLLLVCVGKFTKRIDELQGMDKGYSGQLFLGATTPSYDAESEVDEEFQIDHITEDMIKSEAEAFLGESQQIPPMFSAIKIGGQALYKLARKGKTVERKSRSIFINKFDIINVSLPHVDFYVECSKGTYIRSLAYDLGRNLKSGAYLCGLRRTSIGDFDVNNALQLDEVVAIIEQAGKEGENGSETTPHNP